MTSGKGPSAFSKKRSFVGGCALAVFLGVVFTASLREIRNADLGFHLAAGRVMLETGSVPRADDFSHTARGEAWRDFEWLYQVLSQVTWQTGGAAGVLLLHALLNVLTFATLAWALFRGRGVHVLGLGMLALALLVCEARFSVRPHAAGRLFFALMLAGILAHRRGAPRSTFRLLVLQAVWANVHGSYFAALLVAGLLLVDSLFERRRPGATAVLFLGLVLASWLTPYGWSQTWSLLSHRAAVSAGGANPEWRPLVLTASNLGDPAFLAFAGLCFIAAYRLWRCEGYRPGWFEWAIWLLAVFAPFVHVRAMPLSAIALVVLAGDTLRGVTGGGGGRGPARWAVAVALVVLLLMGAAFLTGTYWRLTGREERWGLRVSERAPGYGAGRFLARFNRLGPLFNTYDTGGWLIWWLHPKGGWVYIDGRDVGNVYGPELIAEYLGLLLEPGRFDAAAQHYRWSAVVLERRHPLCRALIEHLQSSGTWRIGHLDEVSVVFLPAEVFAPPPGNRPGD